MEAITNSSLYGNVASVFEHDVADISSMSWPGKLFTIVVLAALVEQAWFQFRRLRYGYKGPLFIVPFIGGESGASFNRRVFGTVSSQPVSCSLRAGIVSMIQSPYAYWERQRQYDPSGASCNSIFGWFMVRSLGCRACYVAQRDSPSSLAQIFVTLPEAARNILNNNGPDGFKMVLHPSGSRILGDNNIGALCPPPR
jgi:hypothetical protein